MMLYQIKSRLLPAVLFTMFATSSCFADGTKKDPWHGVKGHYNYCADVEARDPNVGSKGIYNKLARGLIEPRLKNGFIVSLEKTGRTSLGLRSGFHTKHLNEPNQTGLSKRQLRNRKSFFKRAFNDPKAQYVSHIHEYTDFNSCSVFNAHRPENAGNCSPHAKAKHSFAAGLQGLRETLSARLKTRLDSDTYSHILFMSMGWHNDQTTSICRYRRVVQGIESHAQKSGQNFKPLVIGLTWPSAWLAGAKSQLIDSIGHISSIFNKSTDADEVGYLHGNLLLNRIIPAANAKNLPVIAIGHSMGARVVGTSIFSRTLLDQPVGKGPDLAILLQPAFSVYRLSDYGVWGVEGNPYLPTKAVKTKLIVTTSEHDKANPIAIWTKYIGGKRGLPIARKSQKHIAIVGNGTSFTNTMKSVLDHKFDQRSLLVDARSFVFDHNDIMSDKMAHFIAGSIFAFSK